MRRAFVIVNPAAGAGRTRRLWPRIRAQLSAAGLDLDWRETSRPGDATTIARVAARDGWPLVIAIGGDGTVNEVVNGLAGSDGEPRAALGAILTGRGRDVARSFGLTTSTGDAVRRLSGGVETVVDLGLAEWGHDRRRYFLNAAGVGFDALVARRAAALAGPGTIPYLAALLASLPGLRPVEASVRLDGAPTWSGAMTTIVVANGVYYGGGMKIAPSANPADGALDVLVVGALSRGELLRWLPAVYGGRHLAHRSVTAFRARTITIETDRAVPMHLDGETVAETPASLHIRPAALRLRR